MALIDLLKDDGDVVKAEVVAKTDDSGTSITFYTRDDRRGINAISNIIKAYFTEKGLWDSDYSISDVNYKQNGILDEVAIEAGSPKGEIAVKKLAEYLSRNKRFGFKSEEYVFKKSKLKRHSRY